MKGYITLKKQGDALFTEKRSEFIGYACPVSSEREALEFIASIKQKHADARHNVWAYTLRENNTTRFSDDGEPHGTAGIPVLDVLRKPGITDAAIVVTRYFGGILLGAGGLVRAYSKAASMAVEAAGTAFIEELLSVTLRLSYSDNARCELIIASVPHGDAGVNFAGDVETTLLLREADLQRLTDALTDATAGRASVTVNGRVFGTI